MRRSEIDEVAGARRVAAGLPVARLDRGAGERHGTDLVSV